MKIFALETDLQKACQTFCPAGESPLLIVRYHPFRFFISVIRYFFFTVLLSAAAGFAAYLGMPWTWIVGVFAVVWLVFILPGVIRAYIDWRFDAIVITEDHVIILDQTSLFHAEARQMHLENFASVSASTQMWNLFPFGKLYFDLKEGVGERLVLKYIPNAAQVALTIGSTVRNFQRFGRSGQQPVA